MSYSDVYERADFNFPLSIELLNVTDTLIVQTSSLTEIINHVKQLVFKIHIYFMVYKGCISAPGLQALEDNCFLQASAVARSLSKGPFSPSFVTPNRN